MRKTRNGAPPTDGAETKTNKQQRIESNETNRNQTKPNRQAKSMPTNGTKQHGCDAVCVWVECVQWMKRFSASKLLSDASEYPAV